MSLPLRKEGLSRKKCFLFGNSISDKINEFRLGFCKYPSYELYMDKGTGVEVDLNEVRGWFFAEVRTGFSVQNKTIYPMLNTGLSVSPWQPYVSQSVSLSTPNGLPGIPVDSGGNYTDAEGQQRACDVKDYSIGKYTQMVGHIESYNGETITTPYMSTTGQLSTGAEVYYVLDEPVVTDISAEELAAYRDLHTYDGATVVSTAEDVAGLEVKYVADAQKYIDDRLTAVESHIQEIAAAQLNAQTGG